MTKADSTVCSIRQMSEPWNDAAANGARSPDSVLVYTRLYEVLAGYSPPPRFKFSPPDEDERVSLQHRLIYLNWLASKPMVYTLQTWISHPPAFGKLYWPRSDFFIHACVVSLDLRADHSRLLGEITAYLFGNTYLAHDTIYGSVCNYDTVMALRIDNARSRSLDAWHVSFDLLPIHRRESGFVDINAVIPLISRLGQSHCSSPLIWRALSIFNQFDHRNDSDTVDVRSTMSTPTTPISLFSMTPELLALVVHHLDDRDLLNFALASHTTMLAVHRTAPHASATHGSLATV